MKTSLKIFLLAVALIVMNGCSAQRRAERLVRRAVALCPELVQVKAHPIDTVLTAPGFADMARVPLPPGACRRHPLCGHGSWNRRG